MRYGVFSISGFLTPVAGGADRPVPVCWYVYDADLCGEIVFRSDHEHVARKEALGLNADERRWEKEQEHARG
jgi:hypothetical protein